MILNDSSVPFLQRGHMLENKLWGRSDELCIQSKSSTDPSMVPLIILLDTEIELVQGGTFFESYTVEVTCEGGAKAPLRVALDPYIEGKLKETLYVEDKTGSCLLSFTGIQSFSGLNISYQIVDGSDSSAGSMLLMNVTENITMDGRFALPTLYSRCLKETLAGVIDPNHLYTGSYQAEAFAWLSNEAPTYPDCSSNRDYLIERFALVALNTAEEAPESWISSSDHCLWSRVRCDGSRVVEVTYGKAESELVLVSKSMFPDAIPL